MDDVVIPKPISAVKDFLLKPQKLLIGGKHVDTVSGKTFEVFDPFSNLLLTHVPKGGKGERKI